MKNRHEFRRHYVFKKAEAFEKFQSISGDLLMVNPNYILEALLTKSQ